MTNVIHLRRATEMDIPPDRVLTGALEAKLEDVIVIGRTADNQLYAASSSGYSPLNLWLAERFRHKLLSGDFDGGTA